MKKDEINDLIAILKNVIGELEVLANETDPNAIPMHTYKLRKALESIKKDEKGRAKKILDAIRKNSASRDATPEEEAEILEMRGKKNDV